MARYEQRIIRPILNAIEKNQEYLTKPENLPQLAKLGFMYNLFWYAGRVSYGWEGKVEKGSQCENNPKYELGDTIEYIDEEIEDLVYDAWGMHVSNDGNGKTWDEIKELILNGKPLTDFQIKCRKPNKTFDEWVEVLTDKKYKYHSIYPDRRSVADHVLCCFGNGYGYNKETGMVFSEASGADQDVDSYGDWENCVFLPKIQKMVNRIMEIDMAKLAVEAELEARRKWQAERNKEDSKGYEIFLVEINNWLVENGKEKITFDDDNFLDLAKKWLRESSSKLYDDGILTKEEKPFDYYPWCNYSIITMIDENSHDSYMKAALEICLHTMRNPPEVKESDNEYQREGIEKRVKFASDFVVKYMGEPAVDDNPKVLPKHMYGHK